MGHNIRSKHLRKKILFSTVYIEKDQIEQKCQSSSLLLKKTLKSLVRFAACLMTLRSSSVLEHIERVDVGLNKSKIFFFNACISKCHETRGCVGITFGESDKDCWLKSETANQPNKKRSFLVMDCLKQPGYIFHVGYHLYFTSEGKPTLTAMSCPKGYKNWMPMSKYCYRLIGSVPHPIARMAGFKCQESKGQLALVDSDQLNYAFVEEISRVKPQHKTMWLGWKFGKLRK